ncbi:hypothetical protein 2 [Hubei picorna-like virus 76]|uniref:hypothetical protein 2 n=1 Tax=Hubei picorna-like virus 76 TaxID=1923160 RepID=UPI00090BA86D|nr:hypothetical protein 2 [Hubei picorna-like virus 76]APG77519.1 hypothetical protein 2 [Hubei picorna-like virus 76]
MATLAANQPDPGSGEIFDSTAIRNETPLSAVGGQGGPTQEAPQHVGEVNTIDQFLRVQSIHLSTTTWSTSADAGTLLFSVPIHPSFTHVYLGHLWKMYNAWAGGTDFDLYINATGFHAGKLGQARIPPNIHPSTLRSISDWTAFEYQVLDAKTMQGSCSSIIDQRNTMYHYQDFDENNPSTFGGYFCVFVIAPLATSSTGATSVSILIFSKPASNFTFAQLRPLKSAQNNAVIPPDLEKALDFRRFAAEPVQGSEIQGMTVHSLKGKKILKDEVINCAKFGGAAMYEHLFTPISSGAVRKKQNFVELQANLQVVRVNGENYIRSVGRSDLVFNTLTDNPKEPGIPYVDNLVCVLTFVAQKADSTVPSSVVAGFFTNNTKNPQFHGFWANFKDNAGNWDSYGFMDDEVPELKTDTSYDLLLKNFFIQILQVTLPDSAKTYAPPITESVIDFQTYSRSSAQPLALQMLLKDPSFDSVLPDGQTLNFELWDEHANLPIMPLRLHRDGFFSTVAQDTDLVFDLTTHKYALKYIGRSPATSALSAAVSRAPSEYKRNFLHSRLVATVDGELKF